MDAKTRASPPGRPAQRTNRLKLHMRKFREAQSEDVSKQDWPLLLEDGDAVSRGCGHRKPRGRGSDRVFLLERSGRRLWRFRAGSAGWTAQSLAMPVSCSARCVVGRGNALHWREETPKGLGRRGSGLRGALKWTKGQRRAMRSHVKIWEIRVTVYREVFYHHSNVSVSPNQATTKSQRRGTSG